MTSTLPDEITCILSGDKDKYWDSAIDTFTRMLALCGVDYTIRDCQITIHNDTATLKRLR